MLWRPRDHNEDLQQHTWPTLEVRCNASLFSSEGLFVPAQTRPDALALGLDAMHWMLAVVDSRVGTLAVEERWAAEGAIRK